MIKTFDLLQVASDNFLTLHAHFFSQQSRTMQLRSGWRLVYPPPAPKQQGGDHRRRSQQSSEDRISSLPEDLLLEILIRLRSVADAARAGAVSRRWSGLWTELPELTFLSDQPLSVQSTLTRITRPSLDLLNIYLWSNWDEDWDGQVSLLPTAPHGCCRRNSSSQ